MATQTSVVCDVCGKPATETITFRIRGAGVARSKDLCGTHLREITKGSSAVTRGRPPAKHATKTRKRPAKKKVAARRKRRTREQIAEAAKESY